MNNVQKILHELLEDDIEGEEIPSNDDFDDVFEVSNPEDQIVTLYEDDDWKVCKPTSEEGFKYLSKDTGWLANSYIYKDGQYIHIPRKDRYNMVDEDSWLLGRYDNQFVIISKNNPKKKFRFNRGYGDIYVASGARYSCATWVATNGSEGLQKWFIQQNFPYITTNLKKKLGAETHKNVDVYEYPDDYPPDWYTRAKLNISNIRIKPGTEVIKDIGNFTKVTNLVIPEGVKRINSRSCYNLERLTNIQLPSTLTKIGDYAFSNCKSLKQVFIPKNVKTIGRCIFECWDLSGNSAPNSFVDSSMVIYCEAESKPDGWSDNWNVAYYKGWYQSQGAVYYKWKTVWGASGLPNQPSESNNDTKEESLIIEDKNDIEDTTSEITNDDSYDFDDMFDVRNVESKIKTLFQDEHWKVETPENYMGLIELEEGTVWNFENKLETSDHLDIDSKFYVSNWNNYKVYVFTNKDTNKKYVYSMEVLLVNDKYSHLFDDEGNIIRPEQTVRWSGTPQEYLAHWLETIEDDKLVKWAISNWKSGLKKFNTTFQAKQIAQENNFTVVYNSELWKKIFDNRSPFTYEVDLGVVGIERNLIDKFITNIKIPKNTKTIKEYSFAGYRLINDVKLPDSIEIIERGAFGHCNGLSRVYLSNNLKEIGNYAFNDCNIEQLWLPNNVKTIGRCAFYANHSLSNVFIPKSVEFIGENAFGYWSHNRNTQIYCEAESKPAGWDDNWCSDSVNNEVHWGCTNFSTKQEQDN